MYVPTEACYAARLIVLTLIVNFLLSFSDNNALKYPFFYRHLESLSEEDGWDMFSTDMEFYQMCTSTQNWKISHVNADYQVIKRIIN